MTIKPPSDAEPQVLWAGMDGVLLRFALTPKPDAIAAAQQLAEALTTKAPKGAIEIAPGLVSVLVRFDPSETSRTVLAKDLMARAKVVRRQDHTVSTPARRWTIPVAFGGEYGPQLEEVAQAVGCSPKDAIRQICDADLRVLVIGFAPGQPYIGLLPDAWNLPRQSGLTPSVPAGAIVVAVRQIVMFGAESATGWRQVGRTAFRSFRPDHDTPMPLMPGDAIRYVAAPGSDVDALERAGDPAGGAKLEVLR